MRKNVYMLNLYTWNIHVYWLKYISIGYDNYDLCACTNLHLKTKITFGQQEGLIWPHQYLQSLFVCSFVNISCARVLLIRYDLMLFKVCKFLCSICFGSLLSAFFFALLCLFSSILFLFPLLVCLVLTSLVYCTVHFFFIHVDFVRLFALFLSLFVFVLVRKKLAQQKSVQNWLYWSLHTWCSTS